MDANPCESCAKACPYRLFIDCPDWLAWAAEKNRAEETEAALEVGTDEP